MIKLLQKDTVPKMQALSDRIGNYSHAWRTVEPLTKKELEVLRLISSGYEEQQYFFIVEYIRQYVECSYQEHLQQTDSGEPFSCCGKG